MFSLVKFIKLLDIFNYTNSLSQLIFLLLENNMITQVINILKVLLN